MSKLFLSGTVAAVDDVTARMRRIRFAGDATASVAFGAMLRALPADAPVHCVVEAADRLPLPREVTWTDNLLDTLRALDRPDEPGVAYLAGEARVPGRPPAPGKRGMDQTRQELSTCTRHLVFARAQARAHNVRGAEEFSPET